MSVTLEEFCALWPQAQKQGWTIKMDGYQDDDQIPHFHLKVSPPASSPMAIHHWAARWIRLDFGGQDLFVPSFFKSLKSQIDSQSPPSVESDPPPSLLSLGRSS